MIWVYALTEEPSVPVPRGHGLAGAPLQGLPSGDLLAVVSRHARVPPRRAPEDLWAHAAVADGMMGARRAVLPMRFGTVLADPAELRGLLAPRHGALVARLHRLRGRVELAVRVATRDRGREEERAADGRGYLARRLAEERAAREVADTVTAALAPLAAEDRRRPGRAPGEVLRAAYLVDATAVERFRAAVCDLAAAHPHLAVVCTGPWPPYSFAGGAGDGLAPVAAEASR